MVAAPDAAHAGQLDAQVDQVGARWFECTRRWDALTVSTVCDGSPAAQYVGSGQVEGSLALFLPLLTLAHHAAFIPPFHLPVHVSCAILVFLGAGLLQRFYEGTH